MAQPIHFMSPDTGEETARADLYGLLANLFAAPPSAQLLAAIAAAPVTSEGVLGQAWQALANAARDHQGAAGVEAVREEYERLFIGIGKPEVMLYGSFYLAGFLMERPLAALRTELAMLGLERADDVFESEDHVASLCEVMRYLIAGDDASALPDSPPQDSGARLAVQKGFFSRHLQPWGDAMCAAVKTHPHALFYCTLAELARAFFEVEAQAFEIGVAT